MMKPRQSDTPGIALYLAALACVLASCTFGSATTERPALPRPAVEPDGAFWDAIETSRRGNAAGFLHLASPRLLHASFIPGIAMPAPESQREFTELRNRVDQALAEGAARNNLNLEEELQRFAEGYMGQLRELAEGAFLEASRPSYEILYTNEHGFPFGPNRAWIDVAFYPREPLPEGKEPETRRVEFVQDGHRWLIERISEDALEGRYRWPQ